jgi:hypothetical protein
MLIEPFLVLVVKCHVPVLVIQGLNRVLDQLPPINIDSLILIQNSLKTFYVFNNFLESKQGDSSLGSAYFSVDFKGHQYHSEDVLGNLVSLLSIKAPRHAHISLLRLPVLLQ